MHLMGLYQLSLKLKTEVSEIQGQFSDLIAHVSIKTMFGMLYIYYIDNKME